MVIPVNSDMSTALNDISEQYSSKSVRSEEALERRRAKKKKKKYEAAARKAAADCEKGSYRPVQYELVEAKRIHSDEHCQAVWGGELAFPRGCGSFVDSFAEENIANDVGFVSQGTVVQVVDSDSVEELCTIEGKAFQGEGTLDITEERRHIRNASGVVASPMARKRGKSKPGYGDVWAMGTRYRYTEPRNSERQKLASVALKKGVNPQKYFSVLQHIQKVSAVTMKVVANWSKADKEAVLKQHRLISQICAVPGNAGFAFPIVSGSENGGFGAHFDPRDVRCTVWASLGYGALVFPSHELTVYLQPGDVIRFNAATFFHANTVKPTVDDIVQRLRGFDFYSEQQQQSSRVSAEAESGSATLPGREASSWGSNVGSSDSRQRTAELRKQAEQMLHDHARWIDQSIQCHYYQSQQQSYMVNRHNRDNPETPIDIDENGAWQEAPRASASESHTRSESGSDSDPHEEMLSEYEIARLARIRENQARMAALGVRPVSHII